MTFSFSVDLSNAEAQLNAIGGSLQDSLNPTQIIDEAAAALLQRQRTDFCVR